MIEPAKAKPIWDRMAQYEFQYGDHLAAQKMAQRYADTYPESELQISCELLRTGLLTKHASLQSVRPSCLRSATSTPASRTLIRSTSALHLFAKSKEGGNPGRRRRPPARSANCLRRRTAK